MCIFCNPYGRRAPSTKLTFSLNMSICYCPPGRGSHIWQGKEARAKMPCLGKSASMLSQNCAWGVKKHSLNFESRQLWRKCWGNAKTKNKSLADSGCLDILCSVLASLQNAQQTNKMCQEQHKTRHHADGLVSCDLGSTIELLQQK